MATHDNEEKVLLLLKDAWNAFMELRPGHPADIDEFSFHIHALQNILGCRIAAKDHPDLIDDWSAPPPKSLFPH